ncbi:hypothetical protein EBU99_14670, partial [bacterium]|nr:hypothetical protein [bacterium]
PDYIDQNLEQFKEVVLYHALNLVLIREFAQSVRKQTGSRIQTAAGALMQKQRASWFPEVNEEAYKTVKARIDGIIIGNGKVTTLREAVHKFVDALLNAGKSITFDSSSCGGKGATGIQQQQSIQQGTSLTGVPRSTQQQQKTNIFDSTLKSELTRTLLERTKCPFYRVFVAVKDFNSDDPSKSEKQGDFNAVVFTLLSFGVSLVSPQPKVGDFNDMTNRYLFMTAFLDYVAEQSPRLSPGGLQQQQDTYTGIYSTR